MADRITTPVAREVEPEVQPAEAAEASVKKTASSGGFKTWFPLLATVVVMPALAYATTQFILLPKIQKAMTQGAAGAGEPAGDASKEKDAAPAVAGGKEKVLAPLSKKILVNVAGSMMTRYLTMSLTLVGNTPDFKDRINKNMDQLMDLATGTLMTKTIADLEKPGERNVIRSELLTVFNNAMGGPVIQDIYITEQAIQ
jgi:flagellar basal body-associated protein FliL